VLGKKAVFPIFSSVEQKFLKLNIEIKKITDLTRQKNIHKLPVVIVEKCSNFPAQCNLVSALPCYIDISLVTLTNKPVNTCKTLLDISWTMFETFPKISNSGGGEIS
jgi:hypothetical protein